MDGALTVELDEGEVRKFYLLKFDSTTGNLIGTPLLLPLSGLVLDSNTSFRYDETLNRYYIAGANPYNYPQISFNGVDFGQQNTGDHYCFLISFNPDDLDDWWYKEIVLPSDAVNSSEIPGIEIDTNSDIYITGSYFSLSSISVSFGEHTFSNAPYHNYRPFILKMNSQGEVQWSKIPDTQGGGGAPGGSTFKAYDLTINGDEVAMAAVGTNTEWGDFSMSRPNNHGSDPVLVRFDKETGEVIGLHDIMGYQGGNYYMTAVTADNDGNYVVGGAMRSILFTDNPNGIPTLYNSGSGNYTDFFFARLANSVCGSGNVSTELFKQQTLRLYPNPTNGMVYIEVPEGIQSYEVYNLVGQRLMSGNINNNNNGNINGNININLQELSQGTYIIKVRTQSGEVMTGKVIRQ